MKLAHHFARNIKLSVMKELIEREWEVDALDSEGMNVQGGLTFRELLNLLEKAAALAEELEKYWPRFRRGFVAGWEAA